MITVGKSTCFYQLSQVDPEVAYLAKSRYKSTRLTRPKGKKECKCRFWGYFKNELRYYIYLLLWSFWWPFWIWPLEVTRGHAHFFRWILETQCPYLTIEHTLLEWTANGRRRAIAPPFWSDESCHFRFLKTWQIADTWQRTCIQYWTKYDLSKIIQAIYLFNDH